MYVELVAGGLVGFVAEAAYRVAVLALGARDDIVLAQAPSDFLEAVADAENRNSEVKKGRVGVCKTASTRGPPSLEHGVWPTRSVLFIDGAGTCKASFIKLRSGAIRAIVATNLQTG